MSKSLTPYQAVKRMRELTELGIPFSFEFQKYNSTTEIAGEIKRVENAQLRKGYRNDQSDKAESLIGYELSDGRCRWFYLPLLLKFNDIRVL